jgi:DNA-binding transcriptional MerR regulator
MIRQEKKLTINELCSLAGMTKRKVRYYIQKGLVDRPKGTGKGAHYTTTQLDQLLGIRKWKIAGLSLERIQELLTGEKDVYQSDKPVPPPLPKKQGLVEVWSHMYLDDGIEIHIEPKRAGLSPEKVRALFREVLNLYEKIREEEP